VPEASGPSGPDGYETELDIEAPPEVVFRHLVDPAAMVTWMGQHALLEPAAEGRFEVDVNGVPVRGRYLVVDPPRRVVVTWGIAASPELPAGSGQVEFTLPPSATGTRLRLVHSGLTADQRDQHRVGWAHFLHRLAVSAAGGDPGPDPWDEPAPAVD